MYCIKFTFGKMYSSVLKLAAPAVNLTDLIIVEKVAYKNFIYSSESKHRLWLGLSVQYSKSEGLSQVPHKKNIYIFGRSIPLINW